MNYVEGRNIFLEYRVARGPAEHRPHLDELVARRVDMIVTWTTPAVRAARDATNTIPILSITGDPVHAGLAESLSRPGGNVTGIAILTDDLAVKILQLLKEALPSVVTVAILTNPDNPVWSLTLKRLQDVAPSVRVRLQSVTAREGRDLDEAFAEAARSGAGAMLIVNDGVFTAHRERIVELAMSRRLPTIAADRPIVEAGGLMSYGVDFPGMLRRLARYVDRIVKGAKPHELAIEQATTFELFVNVKTAKALGVTIPAAVLLRAAKVIE